MYQSTRTRTSLAPAAAIACAAACLLLIFAVPALAAGGWQSATSGTTQSLSGLAALAGGQRWATGAGGVIVASGNDGASWTAQPSGTAQDLRAVAFADATHGWVVGAGGAILATTDGGATWTPQTSGSATDLSGIACSGVNTAWAVGAGGTILATTNGGGTWTPQTSGSAADLSGVACGGANTAWAVGAGGTILATTNGGGVWTAQTSGTGQSLRAVTFADASRGLAAGAAGTILTTWDGGATWTTRSSGSSRDLAGLAFGDASRAWAVGAAGTILRTTDGGATWAAQTAGASQDLAAVAFADDHRGAVAGAGGTILTTSTAGAVDSTPPRTTASGLQTKKTKGWRHTAQTVTLRATDAGSGVAATYYTVDKQPRQTYAAPFAVSAAGSHTIKYWSVDCAGNVEAKLTGYVNIDRGQPVCKALGNVKGYTGSNAKFSFRVVEPQPTCGAGEVSIAIVKGGKTYKRIRMPRVSFNASHTATWKVTLKAGQYTWVVTATDFAGNVQSKKGIARLTVTTMPLPTMADVQRRLVALHYLPSSAVNGKSDYRTSQAILAFQAWNGLSRDGVAGVATRTQLAKASAPVPRNTSGYGHYVEVYRSRGVALCVDGGTLVRAVHCATGRPGYETTPGTWRVYLKSLRFWSQKYSAWMPYASFFNGSEGLHGYSDVPAYPASHGCVRLSMPEAPWVYDFAAIGTTVYVY